MQKCSYENKFDLQENEPVGGTHESKNSFELIKLKTRLVKPFLIFAKEFIIGSHLTKKGLYKP